MCLTLLAVLRKGFWFPISTKLSILPRLFDHFFQPKLLLEDLDTNQMTCNWMDCSEREVAASRVTYIIVTKHCIPICLHILEKSIWVVKWRLFLFSLDYLALCKRFFRTIMSKTTFAISLINLVLFLRVLSWNSERHLWSGECHFRFFWGDEGN